jgi:hypothetical protein
MKLFGRTENEKSPAQVSAESLSASGKGRPTPSRKEAEAAAKERARAGMDKKSAQKLVREKRTESNRRMREGMKSGDEKFLPARDQGPVKRFTRDFVDSRLTFAEFLLPVLVLIMIGGSIPEFAAVTSGLWVASILLLLVDTVLLRLRLKKALKAKFPDENLKGTTFYAYIRMLQIRFMRLPKPNVRVGGKPR